MTKLVCRNVSELLWRDLRGACWWKQRLYPDVDGHMCVQELNADDTVLTVTFRDHFPVPDTSWMGVAPTPPSNPKLKAEVHQVVHVHALRLTEEEPKYHDVYSFGGTLVATLQDSFPRLSIEALWVEPPTAGNWSQASEMRY